MKRIPPHSLTRREVVLAAPLAAAAMAQSTSAQSTSSQVPWYRRAYRWGQTNITEKDPDRYDIPWWRAFWKRTETQAVIINAGGIVAYYPSKFPLHYRAQFLKGRDLFGELTEAAHKDGLWVMARMDSNRTSKDFFDAHPDWFTRDRSGNPYRAADKYITCIQSPYYDEYLPSVLREIIERSHPDGVTDNSWAGMGREGICYCANCDRKFRAKTSLALPAEINWDDPAYRQWILWSYSRRIELWELNNRTTQAAGGPDCIWSGMNSGSVSAQSRSFRDLREIAKRAHIMMLDHQRRDDDTGFQQNGDTGKRVHSMMGWDKLAPESMAMYQSGPGYYRVASKTPAEARMWMIAGLAGGIQPWWHHIAAYHEDRRMYRTAEPVMKWAKANEALLHGREPAASVGVVWSQRNTDFFGRDEAGDLVDAPYSGFMHALVRARIPYLPVHADDIETESKRISLLILPNIGALSDAQCAAIRKFSSGGGGLLATGVTSLYNEWGDPRNDYGLADLFAAHWTGTVPKLAARRQGPRRPGSDRFAPDGHTYLRLHPEWRGKVDGPKAGDEPPASGERHAVLRGFDDTDIVPYGGTLTPLRVDAGAEVPLTFVPPFPTYPPETSWMRQPKTDIPGLVLQQRGKSRIAFLPADLDRRYGREHLTDHGDLLANIVRWAAGGSIPLSVEGPGYLDCHLYRQQSRWILQIVNLTSAATWRAPLEELIAVGPLRVTLSLPGASPRRASARVRTGDLPLSRSQGQVTFTIPSILDHEMVVLE
ncbi:MAG: Tat pathway signal protein [Bryobacterales bacterium]|nr:Tat pathway signal protein [Bryobacterales bacterium]